MPRNVRRISALAACFLATLFFLPWSTPAAGQEKPTATATSDELNRFINAAIEQASYTHSYDPSYVRLAYPNGDVPLHTGVCSDVLIRAFRKTGLDLQKEVHEDMARHFSEYPRAWGLRRPDTNIDHRRVLNLMVYFQRQGWQKAISQTPSEYLPGDIVAWRLDNNRPHIGLVTDLPAGRGATRQMCHNIGQGVQIEDVLFTWKIIGHYRPLFPMKERRNKNN